MALTEPKIRALKPGLKDLWTTDGHGLRLLVKPNGSRYWRFNYRFGKKQKTLAIGVYPEASLKHARMLRVSFSALRSNRCSKRCIVAVLANTSSASTPV